MSANDTTALKGDPMLPSNKVAKRAAAACMILETAQKVVVVVGVLLAIGSVILGFYAPLRWTYGGIWATEEWHSIVTGIVGAVVILTQTLVTYAVLAYLDAKAEETMYANDEGLSDTAGA